MRHCTPSYGRPTVPKSTGSPSVIVSAFTSFVPYRSLSVTARLPIACADSAVTSTRGDSGSGGGFGFSSILGAGGGGGGGSSLTIFSTK